MTCDEGRPCQRWLVVCSCVQWLLTDSLRFVFHLQSLFFSNFASCNQYPCIHLSCLDICSIKREIGHLCHDERRPKVADKPSTPTTAGPSSQVPGIDLTRTYAPGMSAANNTFARPDRVFLHFPDPQYPFIRVNQPSLLLPGPCQSLHTCTPQKRSEMSSQGSRMFLQLHPLDTVKLTPSLVVFDLATSSKPWMTAPSSPRQLQ